MIAAKMIVRVSVCQFSMLSPQTQGLPVEMIQIANAAMAPSRMIASANSYHRGDCAGWPWALTPACCRWGTSTNNPIKKANTPITAMTIIASTKMVPRCSKDRLTFR